MLLLESQKSQLFEIITNTGLDPARFSWVSRRDSFTKFETLVVADSPYFFEFSYGELSKRRGAKWSPSREFLLGSFDGGEWVDQVLLFRNWVEYVKREISHQNVWENVRQNSAGPDLDAASTPFARAEREQVVNVLKDVRALLISYAIEQGTTEAELSNRIGEIEAKFESLKDAVKTHNKWPWVRAFEAVLTKLIADLALDPNLMRLIRQGFEGVKNLAQNLDALLP